MDVKSNNESIELADAINTQYGPANIGENILSALKSGGKNLGELTNADLVGCSEFHIGGRSATLALAEMADIKKGEKIIDLGSGFGGTARRLVSEYGVEVTALELSTAYHVAACMLAEKIGQSGVEFINDNATDIPFEKGIFDVVWMQHTQMNIADKPRLFSETKRVMKPAGRFAWHGILRGNNGKPVLYPVTWADTSELSFLVSVDAFIALTRKAGLLLDENSWKDMNKSSLDYLKASKTKLESMPKEKQLGANLLMGSSTLPKISNLINNIESERISVHMGVFRAQ